MGRTDLTGFNCLTPLLGRPHLPGADIACPDYFEEALCLRVVFPLTEPWKPPGRKCPKNGEKLQNSPPRSNPRKKGKITEKLQKMYFRSIFCNFSVIFPYFRGLDRGGEFCNFSPFFGHFRPGAFRGSVRGKTTRNSVFETGAGLQRRKRAH